MQKTQRGITLVELIVVISVIGILTVALGFTYKGWKEKYAVESEVFNVFVDLQESRQRMIGQTHTPEIMVIHEDKKSYTVYEDRDHDRIYTADANHPKVRGTWPHRIGEGRTFWMTPNNYAVSITGRAMLAPDSHLQIVAQNDADVNCLRIEPIHLRRGWFDKTRGECTERK